MRYRQIHLDFHTSEHIPGIGSRFDPEQFADTFARADVDSVTVFSKCHHGWSYHPTKVGATHPHLDFDLLKAELDALHKRDIKAPIYVSAGWDEKSAREHPGFGWETNMGYGTPEHLTALRTHGPTPHHRASFAPVAQLMLI